MGAGPLDASGREHGLAHTRPALYRRPGTPPYTDTPRAHIVVKVPKVGANSGGERLPSDCMNGERRADEICAHDVLWHRRQRWLHR